jgi:adenosylcobinamide kinase/adenosylcobinamide-phosphate guanylyltransferase
MKVMSKVILITGACRSGKSSYAEKLLVEEEDVLYIATAKALDK